MKQNQSKKKGRKRLLQGGVRNEPKKAKTDESRDESNSDDVDQVSGVVDIQCQIVNGNECKKPCLRELKEHIHFQVNVTCGGSADVTCKISS